MLASCGLYDAPEVPEMKTPQHFKVSIKSVNKNLEDEWWKNFHDKQLTKTVELALKNNYDYRIAIKNIDIAQTYVSQNMSSLFPQVSSGFGASRNKLVPSEFFGAFSNPSPTGGGPMLAAASPVIPTSTGFSNAPFNVAILSASASYEVDVWNQIRNSVKQAESTTAATFANAQVVKLTLISDVVNAYYQIMALDKNIKNLQEQYRITKEMTGLAKVQLKSGLIDASDFYTAEMQEEVIVANLKILEKQKQITEYTLAYLLGEYPENFTITPKDAMDDLKYDQLIPPGVPSSMLGMRPDIQMAYYQVLAYGYAEKESIANFLPSFTITGGYGYADNTLGQLLQSSNAFWNYGIGVSQFVFDYKIRESEYERAKYQFDTSVMNYQSTVINAFTEVNSALISYKKDNEARLAIEKQYYYSNELLDLADAQYKAGLTNYNGYLTDKLMLLQKEYALTSQELLLIQDIIQVYKTLGWGLYDSTSPLPLRG